MSRPLLRLAVALAVAAAAAGHVWFWYWPREHSQVPNGERLPASLLGDERFAVRIWIPYPHQNLGRLARSIEEPGDYLAASARLAGLSEPKLPGFGPFRVPPARELAAAYGGADGESVVAVRLYPLMAGVGRLAGRLAGNPWLAGGEVRWQGRRAEVRWESTLWMLASDGYEASLVPAGPLSQQPALGGLSLRQGISPIAAGPHLLRRSADGALSLAAFAADPSDAAPVGEELLGGETFLVALNGYGGPFGEEPSALALQRVDAGPLGTLPSAAVLYRDRGERFFLPAERLADVLGIELYRGSAAGFDLLALDRRSLDAAEGRAEQARQRIESGELRFGLWLEPAPLLAFARRVRTTLEAVPLVPRREIDPWRDIETVLAPLANSERITLVTATGGSALWLEPPTRADSN